MDKFDNLIRSGLIPKGYRPKTDDEIDAMLNSICVPDDAEALVGRVLQRIQGTNPTESQDEEICVGSDENSLMLMEALYRAKGDDIPPEITRKLEEIRKRAIEEDSDGK